MTIPNISIPAALIGEPTRAAILMVLCDGCSRSAGELADAVNISAQSASNHLGLLREGGLVTVVQQGRHRYFRLTSPLVAQSIEALAVIAPPLRLDRLARRKGHEALCEARTCYSHLAGRLGVELHDALLARGYMAVAQEMDNGRTVYRPTHSGRQWLREFGIVDDLEAQSCLDWTERRTHIAGPLGVAILRQMLATGLLQPASEPRSLRLTVKGRAFMCELGIPATAAQSGMDPA